MSFAIDFCSCLSCNWTFTGWWPLEKLEGKLLEERFAPEDPVLASAFHDVTWPHILSTRLAKHQALTTPAVIENIPAALQAWPFAERISRTYLQCMVVSQALRRTKEGHVQGFQKKE